jgi:uncharacterized membrane protein
MNMAIERLPDHARRLLHSVDWHSLSPSDRSSIEHAIRAARVARNTNAEFLARRKFGERLSDSISAFGGSWTFIIIFGLFIAMWTGINTGILAPRHKALDPYPYVFLNLLLSMVAALQAPVILMSQNRQATKDRLDAQNDYEVNVKSEVEIRELHNKLDTLREAQWAELVRLQQEQIRLLESLVRR